MTYAPPDILDLDLTGKAAITAAIFEGDMAGGTYGDWASYVNKYSADNNPIFGVDPDNGLHYLECGSDATHGTRIISWFLKLANLKHGGLSEVYLRYVLMPMANVATGMHELGVKLPGLASTSTKETLSLRMEHGQLIAGTPGDYPFVSYWYDAESGAGFGEILPMGTARIRALHHNCIEQRVKLNTVTATPYAAAQDGEGDVWLDDVLAWSTRAKRWRWFADTFLDQVHVNIYHGGNDPPIGPIRYRISRIALSSQKIGPPPELLAAPVQQPDPSPVIVVTDPPRPTEIDDMTPPEVVTLCATAYNAACALAGVPDLPTQLAAAQAGAAASLAQAQADRDAARADAKTAQDALAALKAAITTEHAAIDAAEAAADKAAQA